jgi:hypothetical protein
MPDQATLVKEIATWEKKQNAQQAAIDGRFSLADARGKNETTLPRIPNLMRYQAGTPRKMRIFAEAFGEGPPIFTARPPV